MQNCNKFIFKNHCTEFWRKAYQIDFLIIKLKRLHENKYKIIKKFTG